MGGQNLVHLEFAHPFQPFDILDRLDEILDRADGFQDQRLFRLEAVGIVPERNALALHGALEAFEFVRESLGLLAGGGATDISAATASSRAFRTDRTGKNEEGIFRHYASRAD
jgi:hypothetical protein